MGDMVERVARAICIANGGDPDAYDPEMGAGAYPWMVYEEDARAAIAALDEYVSSKGLSSLDGWCAEVDAALNAKRSPSR
jgi:hypothetical protein